MSEEQEEPSALRRRITQLEQELAEHARMAEGLRHLLAHGAAAGGESFFASMARDLCSVVGADCVLVGELTDDRAAIRTLAVWTDGALQANLTYGLVGTPCAKVVGKAPCVHPRGVQQQFPEDRLLVEMGMERYVGVPVFANNGAPLGILVALSREALRDETFAAAMLGLFAARAGAEMERLRQEHERRTMAENLLHTQKLESLGVLAGGIAHDFNNLLASILGSADLALLELDPDHPATEPLETVVRTAQSAGGLCRQLLAYAGKGRFRVSHVDLARMVGDMEGILRTSAPRRVELEYELPPNLPAVRGDESQLGQIVLNLVTNAAEAIGEEGGHIWVRLGTRTCDAAEFTRCSLVSAAIEPGTFITLEVTDDGCGMDEATLDKIFDPFYTTKFTGRGLGLAALRGIVESHGGAICVRSQPGEGTTFHVLLPAAQQPADGPRSTGPDAWRGSGAALVVDDDPLVRRVATRLLDRLGFTPMSAADGVEALELARRHTGTLRVALVDLMMPHMDGIETFHGLRAIHPTIPVVLMSGYNQQTLVETHVHEGIASFLQKPFRAGELRESVREAIERAGADA